MIRKTVKYDLEPKVVKQIREALDKGNYDIISTDSEMEGSWTMGTVNKVITNAHVRVNIEECFVELKLTKEVWR